MKVCLKLSLLFLALSLATSCALFKNTGTEARLKSVPADTSEDISFINGISIQRDGHATTHKLGSYHSPMTKEESANPATSTDLQKKYAQILDVSSSDIDNPTLFSFIDSWWGAPYRYGGDSRSGIDCSAFVQILYASVFGISSIPRTAQQQYEDSKKIRHIKKLREGDLVFFRIHSRSISHVGIYLSNNKFVHASLSSGVVISDLTDSYWKRYFAGGGEPQEVVGSDGFVAETP